VVDSALVATEAEIEAVDAVVDVAVAEDVERRTRRNGSQ